MRKNTVLKVPKEKFMTHDARSENGSFHKKE